MKPVLLAAALVIAPSLALAGDLTGEWSISSSVGNTPISVHCTLLQTGGSLDGSCAPKDQSRGPLFTGTVKGNHASWGYDVTFRGQPSHVGFEADITGDHAMTGTLSLGNGKPSPFTATVE